MLHQVLKRFSAEGRELNPGDIVETSGWRNERLLLEHRFIGKPSVPQDGLAKLKDGDRITKNGHVPGANSTPAESKKAAGPAKPAALQKAADGTLRVPAVGKVPPAES